ncbi:MAG: SH3 domain-containing protein [Anaerolineae bacterium]|nr:SH3 domain-containing protein [Anaerolineae bacterium]
MRLPLLRRSYLWLVLIAVLLIVPASAALAQGGAITYGSSVAGELTSAAPIAIYTFEGTAGDQVSAHVVSLSPAMLPGVSLLAPDQRQLTLNASDPLGSDDGSVVHISYRLATTGRHTLIVASTNSGAGQFVLHLEGRAAAASEGLFSGTPVLVNLPPNAPPALYSFPANAAAAQTLTLSSNTPGFAFMARVYDGNGQLIAGLAGSSLQSAALTVGPGNGTYEVQVSGLLPDTQGSVQLLLGAGGAGPVVPAQATPSNTPQPGVAASPTPDTCQVTSSVNVNVRTGPGVEYDAIGALFAGSFRQVIGRNSTATWYVIDYNGRQAWVAGSATTLSGPCQGLTVFQAPPTPTPGPPTATATPTITPTSAQAQIIFTVNGGPSVTISAGQCATVAWSVSNVREVYYQNQGVTGVGERQECPGSTTTYTLRVVLNDGTTSDRQVTINVTGTAPTLNPSGSPNYGTANLAAGFLPDPYTVGVTSGGSVDVSYLGGSCQGWATANPDFRVEWSGVSSRLRFYFLSGGDTTLVVRAPGGSWYCDDDSAGYPNPRININNPPEGRYNIWVASYSQSEFHGGTLNVTELNLP